MKPGKFNPNFYCSTSVSSVHNEKGFENESVDGKVILLFRFETVVFIRVDRA